MLNIIHAQGRKYAPYAECECHYAECRHAESLYAECHGASLKHSSLLQTFVNYGHKKFYNIGPWSDTLIKIEGGSILVALATMLQNFLQK